MRFRDQKIVVGTLNNRMESLCVVMGTNIGSQIASLVNKRMLTKIKRMLKYRFVLRDGAELPQVPTKLLVAQQAELFRKYVAENVGEYTGDRGVDGWSKDTWREELRYALRHLIRCYDILPSFHLDAPQVDICWVSSWAT